MGFLKLCVCTAATILLWEFGLASQCEQALTCRDCNLAFECIWNIIIFDGEKAFGRCVLNTSLGAKTPQTFDGADIPNVGQLVTTSCENRGIFYFHAITSSSQGDCFYNNNLLCNFAEASPHNVTEAQVFDVCFLQNADHNLECPSTHTIGSREYTVTQRTATDYDYCKGYATCANCVEVYGCGWVITKYGTLRLGRCWISGGRTEFTLKDIVGADLSSIEVLFVPSHNTCDNTVGHAVTNEDREDCFSNSNRFCDYEQNENPTNKFGLCFKGREPCLAEITVDGKIYVLYVSATVCSDNATCNDCKRVVNADDSCLWCVRGIGTDNHFGHCVDSETQCTVGDSTDDFLKGRMTTANITDVTWTASLKDTCEGGGLAFDNSLKEMNKLECFSNGHMLCGFDDSQHKYFEMCFMKLNEDACDDPSYIFNGVQYRLNRQRPECYNYSYYLRVQSLAQQK